MSSKRRNTKAAPTPRTAVRFKYGPDVRPHTIAEFKRTRGLPRIAGLHETPGLIAERVRSFTQTVNDIVPPGTTVSVWPAIDMAATLAHVAPDEFGPASGNAYTVERGANTAMAKTLTRADGGGFDIVVDGNLFISTQADTDEQVSTKSAVLAHLAAHEPQHIVLTLVGLDGNEVAEAARGESPTVNSFLPAMAAAINEYQAERAANRIALSPFPHRVDGLGDDLASFRESLAIAAGLVNTDYERVCTTLLTAAAELVKGMGYAAAYCVHADELRPAPDPKPNHWDRYVAGLWPDLLDMFATIPAAGDVVEMPALAATVYRMAERVMTWLDEIGFGPRRRRRMLRSIRR